MFVELATRGGRGARRARGNPQQIVKLISTVIIAVGLIVPAVAFASRVATGSTRSAIERAAAPQLPGHIPQRCLLVEETTKDGGNWATVWFKEPNSHSCGRWAFNGVVIVHRARSHWHYVTAGSDLGPCGRLGVPVKVRRDLHLPCR
jgi:hypothetical protein